MINLLPTSAVIDAQVGKIKRKVGAVTTIVLLGYVLLLAGLGGRLWYLSSRQKGLSQELASLTNQVNEKASVEAILRQQESRLSSIRQMLTQRALASKEVDKLAGAEVTSWTYDVTGAQETTATDPSASVLEDYAKTLVQRFATVAVNMLTRLEDGTWDMDLSLQKTP